MRVYEEIFDIPIQTLYKMMHMRWVIEMCSNLIGTEKKVPEVDEQNIKLITTKG